MKVVALIASHKRDEILQDSITCLKPQVDDIVLVGTSDWIKEADTCNIAKRIAKKNDLIYVDHSNKILGQKWQAALNRARLENPDAVLICGSDDLIPVGYVDIFKKDPENILLAGTNHWFVLNPIKNELIRCYYRTEQRSDPIGAGRIISKEALGRCDWQIFPREGGIGCDLYSFRMLRMQADSWQCFPDILSVKGRWSMLDSWEQLLNAQSVDVDFVYRESAQSYIVNNYPNIDFDKYRKKH